MKLLFELIFRKADGSPYTPLDTEKKAMLLFRGGDDMKNLFDHVGKVVTTDSFDATVTKIQDALKNRTNKVVQRNLLLTRHPQGNKSFERWSMEVSNAAKLIDYTGYDWRMAAVDAMVLQTANARLREKALQDNISYDQLMTMGVTKEQSEKGAAQLAGGIQGIQIKEEDIRKVQLKHSRNHSKVKDSSFKERTCNRCGYEKCQGGKRCPANGKRCAKCGKSDHFAQACRSKTKRTDVNQLDDSETDDDLLLNRILEVKKLNNADIH